MVNPVIGAGVAGLTGKSSLGFDRPAGVSPVAFGASQLVPDIPFMQVYKKATKQGGLIKGGPEAAIRGSALGQMGGFQVDRAKAAETARQTKLSTMSIPQRIGYLHGQAIRQVRQAPEARAGPEGTHPRFREGRQPVPRPLARAGGGTDETRPVRGNATLPELGHAKADLKALAQVGMIQHSDVKAIMQAANALHKADPSDKTLHTYRMRWWANATKLLKMGSSRRSSALGSSSRRTGTSTWGTAADGDVRRLASRPAERHLGRPSPSGTCICSAFGRGRKAAPPATTR